MGLDLGSSDYLTTRAAQYNFFYWRVLFYSVLFNQYSKYYNKTLHLNCKSNNVLDVTDILDVKLPSCSQCDAIT